MLRILSILALLTTAACTTMPTAPTPISSPEEMDISWVMPPKTVQLEFTCTTQPRYYILPDGTGQWEIDTYTQPMPCPVVPID